MSAAPITHEEQVQRLLVAIYPTRLEAAMVRFVSWCYTEHDEGSWADRLGDTIDKVLVWKSGRRARRNVRRRHRRNG